MQTNSLNKLALHGQHLSKLDPSQAKFHQAHYLGQVTLAQDNHHRLPQPQLRTPCRQQHQLRLRLSSPSRQHSLARQLSPMLTHG